MSYVSGNSSGGSRAAPADLLLPVYRMTLTTRRRERWDILDNSIVLIDRHGKAEGQECGAFPVGERFPQETRGHSPGNAGPEPGVAHCRPAGPGTGNEVDRAWGYGRGADSGKVSQKVETSRNRATLHGGRPGRSCMGPRPSEESRSIPYELKPF